MKYFHRTSVAPETVLAQSNSFFGSRMRPGDERSRRRSFTSGLGRLTVSAVPEGGHYTLVTVETDQPGESEIDKLAKRFLGVIHTLAEPRHELRGSY